MSSPARIEEDLAVLAGQRGDRRKAAVRRGELDELIQTALRGFQTAAGGGGVVRLASFRYSDFTPGVGYTWELTDTAFPPPAGAGGGAIFLGRDRARTGTWIAAEASAGTREPDLYAMSTSGYADQWGDWRRIAHAGMLLEPCVFDGGVPTGGLLEAPIVNANGTAVRFANGLQVCWHRQSLSRISNDTATATWTLPAAFAAPGATVVATLSSDLADYTGLTAADVGFVSAGQGVTSAATVTARRAPGGTNFPVGGTISNVGLAAIGLWGAP